MQVIYYDTDADLRRLLRARTDAAMPAVVLLPRSLWWLVKDKATPGPFQPYTIPVSDTDMGLRRQRNELFPLKKSRRKNEEERRTINGCTSDF